MKTEVSCTSPYVVSDAKEASCSSAGWRFIPVITRVSQEATKEKGTTCLICFHAGVRRTELLLLLHRRAPSLLWSLFSYRSSFPGEKAVLGSPGKNLGHMTPSHSIIPASSPVLSLSCLDALKANCLQHCPGLWQVSLSAEPAVTMVTSHMLSFASVLCPHLCSHSSGFSPSFLHRLINFAVTVGLISLLLSFMQ